jgi:hypothetical protein
VRTERSVFAHQSLDTLAAEPLADFGEVAMHVACTVAATARQICFLDHHEQTLILARTRRLRCFSHA